MPEERSLEDWLEGYLEYTEETEPPTLFKVWTGLSVISAALQRKCHLNWEYVIYPNIYVILVGPSALSRKGTAMRDGKGILEDIESIKLAPEATTPQALVAALASIGFTMPTPDTEDLHKHSSTTIFSEELAVFLDPMKQTGRDLIIGLTRWYDCPNKFDNSTIVRGGEVICNMWISLLGATTPSLLPKILPQETIGDGLSSRVIFVYGAIRSRLIPYPIEREETRVRLVKELRKIHLLEGKFTYTPEYKDFYQNWYTEVDNSDADHLRTEHFGHYLGRRATHLRKVSMLLNASRTDSMHLELEDLLRALSILKGAEKKMPYVFESYGRHELADMFTPVMQYVMRNGKVDLERVLGYFYKDLDRGNLDRLVEALVAKGYFSYETETVNGKKIAYVSCIWKEKEE